MTKYEWESELKKNIHRLPADEIQRVMEYYDELFADKIERGYGECEIVQQFGNPVDVADKILSEYEGELREFTAESVPVYESGAREEKEEQKAAEKSEKESERTAAVMPEIEPAKEDALKPHKAEKTKKEGAHLDRLALFVVLNVLTGFVFFILVASAWIVLGALIISSAACAVGGAAGAIISVMPLVRDAFAVGAVQIGACVALCGAGILLTIIMTKVIKLAAKLTKALFGFIAGWINPKTEVAYE